jgi:hypothetical protein
MPVVGRLHQHSGDAAYALGAEGIASKKIDGSYRSGRAASGSRSLIPPATHYSGSGARIGIGEAANEFVRNSRSQRTIHKNRSMTNIDAASLRKDIR